MAITDLIPWRRTRGEELSTSTLRQELNRVLMDLMRSGRAQTLTPEVSPGEQVSPRVQMDITEDERNIHVTADLPGVDEKDLEVSVARDVLTIKGEKRHEPEEWKQSYYRSERPFGPFCRAIRLPCEVSTDGVRASFKKGVLLVVLPKADEVHVGARKIEIVA